MLKWTVGSKSGDGGKPCSRIRRAAVILHLTRKANPNAKQDGVIRKAEVKSTRKVTLGKLRPSADEKENQSGLMQRLRDKLDGAENRGAEDPSDGSSETYMQLDRIPAALCDRTALTNVNNHSKAPVPPRYLKRKKLDPTFNSVSQLHPPPGNSCKFPSHHSVGGLGVADRNKAGTPLTTLTQQFPPRSRIPVYRCATPDVLQESPPPLPPKPTNVWHQCRQVTAANPPGSVMVFTSPHPRSPPSFFADPRRRQCSGVLRIHDNTDPRFLDYTTGFTPSMINACKSMSLGNLNYPLVPLAPFPELPEDNTGRRRHSTCPTTLSVIPDNDDYDDPSNWSTEAVMSDSIGVLQDCSVHLDPDDPPEVTYPVVVDNPIYFISPKVAEDSGSEYPTWNSHLARKKTPVVTPHPKKLWREPSSTMPRPTCHSTPRKTTGRRKKQTPSAKSRRSRRKLMQSKVMSRRLAVTKLSFDGAGDNDDTVTAQTKPVPAPRKLRQSIRKDPLRFKGRLKLAMYPNSGLLTIHVISGCRLRASRQAGCEAYIKLGLIPSEESVQSWCRTPLAPYTSRPHFDQKFSFEVFPEDLEKRILLTVWHRQPDKRKSEFLGCMSFGVRHVLKKEISGWFRLLSDKAGRKKHCTLADKKPRGSPTVSLKEHLMPIMDDKSVSNATDQECSSSISSGIDTGGPSSSMEGPDGPRTPHGSVEGRMLGRTPYTVTLEMVKDERGFGFSVAWTHPPRVERVEAGLPAAKAGMRPGDYLIFVSEDNVVKMAEEKVLQLIQDCGNRLVVEVYRKTCGKSLDGLNGISLPSTSKEERPLKSRHGLREMAILNGVQYMGNETPKLSKVAFLRKEAEDEVLASSVSSLATGTGSADSNIYFPPHAGCPVNVTMQDLEDRIVFAKCKAFQLVVSGRELVFCGELSRVEGRSVRPCCAMLFTDLLVLTTVTRDRVVFVVDEPVVLFNVVKAQFNTQKNSEGTEFRLVVETKTSKGSRRSRKSRKMLIFRAPTTELKHVWHSLLQRQILYVNTKYSNDGVAVPVKELPIISCSPYGTPIRRQTASITSKLASCSTPTARTKFSQCRVTFGLGNDTPFGTPTRDCRQYYERKRLELLGSRANSEGESSDSEVLQTTMSSSEGGQSSSGGGGEGGEDGGAGAGRTVKGKASQGLRVKTTCRTDKCASDVMPAGNKSPFPAMHRRVIMGTHCLTPPMASSTPKVPPKRAREDYEDYLAHCVETDYPELLGAPSRDDDDARSDGTSSPSSSLSGTRSIPFIDETLHGDMSKSPSPKCCSVSPATESPFLLCSVQESAMDKFSLSTCTGTVLGESYAEIHSACLKKVPQAVSQGGEEGLLTKSCTFTRLPPGEREAMAKSCTLQRIPAVEEDDDSPEQAVLSDPYLSIETVASGGEVTPDKASAQVVADHVVTSSREEPVVTHAPVEYEEVVNCAKVDSDSVVTTHPVTNSELVSETRFILHESSPGSDAGECSLLVPCAQEASSIATEPISGIVPDQSSSEANNSAVEATPSETKVQVLRPGAIPKFDLPTPSDDEEAESDDSKLQFKTPDEEVRAQLDTVQEEPRKQLALTSEDPTEVEANEHPSSSQLTPETSSSDTMKTPPSEPEALTTECQKSPQPLKQRPPSLTINTLPIPKISVLPPTPEMPEVAAISGPSRGSEGDQEEPIDSESDDDLLEAIQSAPPLTRFDGFNFPPTKSAANNASLKRYGTSCSLNRLGLSDEDEDDSGFETGNSDFCGKMRTTKSGYFGGKSWSSEWTRFRSKSMGSGSHFNRQLEDDDDDEPETDEGCHSNDRLVRCRDEHYSSEESDDEVFEDAVSNLTFHPQYSPLHMGGDLEHTFSRSFGFSHHAGASNSLQVPPLVYPGESRYCWSTQVTECIQEEDEEDLEEEEEPAGLHLLSRQKWEIEDEEDDDDDDDDDDDTYDDRSERISQRHDSDPVPSSLNNYYPGDDDDEETDAKQEEAQERYDDQEDTGEASQPEERPRRPIPPPTPLARKKWNFGSAL